MSHHSILSSYGTTNVGIAATKRFLVLATDKRVTGDEGWQHDAVCKFCTLSYAISITSTSERERRGESGEEGTERRERLSRFFILTKKNKERSTKTLAEGFGFPHFAHTSLVVSRSQQCLNLYRSTERQI